MNRRTLACLLAALSCTAIAAPPADEAADGMLALSVNQEISANDPRIAQTRSWLNKAVQVSGEEATAIAIACSRYVGHLHDSAHLAATPLELLEALARFGKAGKPMNDTLQEYAAARKSVPTRNHADALAAMATKNRK